MLGRMLIAIAVAAFSLSPVAARAQEGGAPVESGHVEVNGLAHYYEVHGEGEPLLLLHGGLEHVVAFYQRLGGGLRDAGWQREHMSQNRLAILPGRTHYDIFFAPALVPTTRSFLDGESATGSWVEQVGAGQQ